MKENTNEIDLIDLFMKGYVFIKNRIKVISFFVFAGAIGGLVYFQIQSEKYEETLIGYSPIISNKILEESVKDLAKPGHKEHIYASPADSSIKQTVKCIKKIESSSIGENTNMLKLTFTTSKPTSKEELTKLINNTLLTNEHTLAKLDLKKQRLLSIIDFLDSQIKVKSESEEKGENGIYINNSETPTTLYKEKKLLEEELAFLQPIVITKAYDIVKPAKTPLVTCLIAGGFLSFIVICAYFILKSINHYSQKHFHNKSKLIVYDKTA